MSEWGPWVEHTTGTMPLPGDIITDIFTNEDAMYGFVSLPEPAREWDWSIEAGTNNILRYRIRKPRALQQLKEMVENLPELETVQ